MQNIQIIAFDKIYPFPRNLIPLSAFLSNVFSGNYAERDHVDLNLDPILEPAFEFIYNYLLDKEYP